MNALKGRAHTDEYGWADGFVVEFDHATGCALFVTYEGKLAYYPIDSVRIDTQELLPKVTWGPSIY